ncbi:MAG: hypothetical protein A2V79_03295 [Betaproteobacteria bacterium RBG_16_56_24]|nr:MAG: hypothetical protein A2V79_03295 [Betaproteobacteria bacterium RBG_16_56_24]
MLCGNPDILRDTVETLLARGLKKNRRSDPGHITVESYWSCTRRLSDWEKSFTDYRFDSWFISAPGLRLRVLPW